MFPIDSDAGLFLAPYTGAALQSKGVSVPDETRRFTRIFAEVWGRIPEANRRLMVHHWHTHPSRTQAIHRWTEAGYSRGLSPFISMVDELGLYTGYCDDHGHTLLFQVAWVVEVQEDFPAWTVAHELAHVFRIANGDEAQLIAAAQAQEDETRARSAPQEEMKSIQTTWDQENEWRTDRAARAWGFRRPGLHRLR
jgi:hypothetical protein